MPIVSSSNVAEQYIRNAYPCLESWMRFVKNAYPNMLNYDDVSCSRLSLVGIAAKKAFDYILQTDSQTNVIRVSRMLASAHESAWAVWTAFSSQGRVTVGTKSITVSPTALEGLRIFNDWDIIAEDPTFDPSRLLNDIIQGVSLT